MTQLRLDPLTGRWVVISSDRGERPFAFMPRSLPVEGGPDGRCPLCPDHATAPTPSLEVARADGQWQVRILANPYPAFRGDSAMAVTNLGPIYTQAPASGVHEVVVIDPRHQATFADLTDIQSSLVMHALAQRMGQHASVPGLRYSQAVINAGREAGASLEHPHGQLLSMPFVPREITDEQAGFARFSGNCLLCATMAAEESVGHRVVYTDDDVQVVCPYWSGTPFEMLVSPTEHAGRLQDAGAASLGGVGRGLQRALSAVRREIGDVAYNVTIHASPFRTTDDFHWHAHVLPKITTRAGFELGTGVLINVVSPERAAVDLRSAVGAVAA